MAIRRRYILLLDAAMLMFAWLARLAAGWMLGNLPGCFVTQFGLLCPSCGGTRCVYFLLSGRVGEALAVNPYLFFTALLLAYLLLLGHLVAFSGGRLGARLFGRLWSVKTVILWAVGFGVFGILRNFLVI